MSVQSVLLAWSKSFRMRSAATLLLVPMLLNSGCGIGVGNPATNANSNAANTANEPSNSSTQTGQAATVAGTSLQLENIQIGDKSVLFTTTHGNMLQAFIDPHIENGNPNRFVVTLVHVNPGKYALNKTTRLQTHWATAMTIAQQGQDLEVQFELLSNIQRFTSAMGAGQMVLYTFQSA